ncbi:hypothetical protein [Pseudonocardia adelaidensis]|uniref:NAD(P)-binding protein n=1 Tax=Pseudonocardia adelaidensis TaxID=648754 RepID=A0ABP9P7W7_9PSEU
MDSDIPVLAANGKSGSRVVAALRAAGHQVRAASRSAEVRFDRADPYTWPAVVTGAGALYLVAPEDPAPAPGVRRRRAGGGGEAGRAALGPRGGGVG